MDRIADEIRSRISVQPTIGLILGSGLGPLSESIQDPTIIPYHDLPGWPLSTVEGHAGELIIGKLEGKDVLLLGMAGTNPLRGPNMEEFGTRFPDMSQAYDRELIKLTQRVAKELDITLYEGIYVCLAGPTFETPADLRFLLNAGVDAVGMSTVPEVIVANHGGQRVLGISGITNSSNLYGEAETTHEEVIETGKLLAPKMMELIRGVLRAI